MRRVLIVDDDATIRNILAMWLEDEGWNVTTAADGEEALRAMRAATHDVVLLDLMMPVFDGWSLLTQRQNDARLRAVPVVVMSAGGKVAIDRALTLGADGHVAKPFELDLILHTLEEVLAPV